jgi:hypothetical protein
VPLILHGGSRNAVIRDGVLILLGDRHLEAFDAKTLDSIGAYPTVVKNGCPKFIGTGLGSGLQGHDVPNGLSVLTWIEHGLVSVIPSGDIGGTHWGRDWVRVPGGQSQPSTPVAQSTQIENRGSANQRGYVAACDGNDLLLLPNAGHAFGRMSIHGMLYGNWAYAARGARVPSIVNTPCHLSTPDCHYVIAPFPVVVFRGEVRWGTGVQINRVTATGKPELVFSDRSLSIPDGGWCCYYPRPWCISGGTIYLWSITDELVAIDTSSWKVSSRRRVAFERDFPRLAVNSRGDVAMLGATSPDFASTTMKLTLVGRWESLLVESSMEGIWSNQQCTNHIAIDDRRVYLARLLGGDLVVGAYQISDGRRDYQVRYVIPGADDSGQVVDFFLNDGAAYALVTPREPTKDAAFHQVLVRVS